MKGRDFSKVKRAVIQTDFEKNVKIWVYNFLTLLKDFFNQNFEVSVWLTLNQYLFMYLLFKLKFL